MIPLNGGLVRIEETHNGTEPVRYGYALTTGESTVIKALDENDGGMIEIIYTCEGISSFHRKDSTSLNHRILSEDSSKKVCFHIKGVQGDTDCKDYDVSLTKLKRVCGTKTSLGSSNDYICGGSKKGFTQGEITTLEENLSQYES